MLLHDVAKPDCATEDEQGIRHFHGHPDSGAKLAGQILRRLTFDNDTVNRVKTLIKHHDERVQPQNGRSDVRLHGLAENSCHL